MDLETLQELLSEFLEDHIDDFKIRIKKDGRIIIYTGLCQDKDGELIDIKNSSEEDEDMEFGDGFGIDEEEDLEDE